MILTLDRFEGERGVFGAEKGEEVTIPKKWLPAKVKEGDAFVLSLATEENYREMKEKKARDLLNEILKEK